jgi:glycosyltransferase involved in cell wall biosynthesis
MNSPTVSVVIPCKGNERTIRPTVEALLGQDYPGLEEVILVGSIGDTTWRALEDMTDPRLVILEQLSIGGRDPNLKRDTGIRKAHGELLALADSDIVLPEHWLSRGIELLTAARVGCVAGGMKSIHDSFWGRYVDGNRLGAKTPRVRVPYLVTRENFGRHGRKPPISANLVFTRKLYDDCPMDVHWIYGYEDYEWFWRLACNGNEVLVSSELYGLHHHRRGIAGLSREYLRSGDGCGNFIKAHPDCPLARKRWCQAIFLPAIAAGLTLLSSALLADGGGYLALGGLSVAAASAVGWEYAKSHTFESLTYPFITAILGSVFLAGLLRSLMAGSLGPGNPPDAGYLGGKVITDQTPLRTGRVR